MDGFVSVVVVVGLDLLIVTYSGVDGRLCDLWVVATSSFSATTVSSSGALSVTISSDSGLLVVDLSRIKVLFYTVLCKIKKCSPSSCDIDILKPSPCTTFNTFHFLLWSLQTVSLWSSAIPIYRTVWNLLISFPCWWLLCCCCCCCCNSGILSTENSFIQSFTDDTGLGCRSYSCSCWYWCSTVIVYF